MVESTLILAQDGFGFEDAVYIVIVALSMLGGFGKWLRNRSANKDQEVETESPAHDKALDAPPAPGRRLTPPIHARQARPAAKVKAESGQRPEAVLVQFLQKVATQSSRPAPPSPTRKPPSPRPVRARRVRARSRVEEVQALEQTMEYRKKPASPPPDLAPIPAHPKELGDFTSLSIAELRRAIVLNEVLGPPIALRGSHQHPR